MTFRDFWKREKHVALHAQPRKFRIGKWIVILAVLAALTYWKGWQAAVLVLLVCSIAGTCLHFILRWKTEAWTKSWGPYKRIPLNGE